ncbi:MAG TPA: MBL fold metallo-hydrolase [Rhabdochlamydiaceae bacterium]|jgi:glyoxylase-like metal-dependent hydrolase (beta-lactamase superfamily II)
MILEIFPLGPAETNAYLLACSQTKRAAIIDAPLDSSKILAKRAKEFDLHIEMLLLTHSHWDHIADAAAFKEKLHLPIYIHSEDAGNLVEPGLDKLPLFFPIKGVDPDHFLEQGQKIPLGHLHIEVIHTPGHTPGGVCFYLEKQKVLFSGDTLFRGAIGNLSFPTARPRLMTESLKKLALLPKDTVVYPGHGESTTIGDESWIVNLHK